MKDMELDDFTNKEKLSEDDIDWVDDTTKTILKSLGIEDVDEIFEELFGEADVNDLLGEANEEDITSIFSMLGLGKQQASRFDQEFDKISKEFEQALAEGDADREEELRNTFRQLYQEIFFETFDEE